MKKQLHFKEYGKGFPLIVAHGLFGMSDNWQTFAKKMGEGRRIITVDLRNHGRSFHQGPHDYVSMAEDVIRLADHLGLDQFDLLGHSMGGKMACQLALSYPERVRGLVVVDILPIEYERGHDGVLNALTGMDLKKISTRKEAEEILSSRLDGDRGTALFLLKSLKRSSDHGFEWKFNLQMLNDEYDNVRSETEGAVFEKKVLFVKGSDSDYIGMDGWLQTLDLFPEAILETVADAGHWVHADQVDELVSITEEFLDEL